MHASVDVHFEITIQDDKTVTLGTLAQSITARDIEQQLVEAVIESVDAQLTEQYCGEKHQPGNGEKRFQRAGTTSRTATTTAGEHEFTLHHPVRRRSIVRPGPPARGGRARGSF